VNEFAGKTEVAGRLREVELEIGSRRAEHQIDPARVGEAALVSLLGDPHRAFPVVHVTGTNGKTSTTRMIETLLRERGLRTGRFTSPHLVSMRERICVDGVPLSAERFVELYDEVKPYIDLVDAQQPARLSFFEVLTGMMFAAFADAPVDVAVIEVGMGGRWDATNVADGTVAVVTPVALDHMQWLGDTVEAIATEKSGIIKPGATAVIAALRDRAPVPRPEMAHTLAAASRQSGFRRIQLRTFGRLEVAELVRRQTGRAPSADTTRTIHARTGGNAFLVRELSRHLRDGGRLTDADGVPATVRDVVRDRVAALDDVTTALLQTAALITGEVDLALLANAAAVPVQACLDHLELLQALGLLEQVDGNPFAFRFTHDLVRESIAVTTPAPRVPGLHLRLARAIRDTATDDEAMVERLAHHLWGAGPLAEPRWTAETLLHAGRYAAAKSALEAAARQLRLAARVAAEAGLVELELSALSQFIAVDGMRAGYVGSALDLLERAEKLARGLGREREAADFLFSRWAAHSQGIRLERAGQLARRLLDQGEASADPLVRVYGRHAWGIHNWDIGNITEAYRYLSESAVAVPSDPARREQAPLRHDLQLLSPVMLALMTALRGDVDVARVRFDAVEAAAGDDAYAITVWSAFSVTAAALAGDPVWALRAAERGIAQDPEFSFVFLGGYQRLARCWAHAVTDGDPASAVEAERLIDVALLDPPRSGLATWWALVGEMWLRAGRPPAAAAALDRADSFVAAHGQRYAEGLILLLRARLMQARGEPAADVRAAARRARALSVERGAHLFARRAEELL